MFKSPALVILTTKPQSVAVPKHHRSSCPCSPAMCSVLLKDPTEAQWVLDVCKILDDDDEPWPMDQRDGAEEDRGVINLLAEC